MVASQHSRLGRTMDFNKAGIPKFGIGDPLGENFVAWSRGMHFPRDSRYGAFAGNVEVEDGQQRYKVRADQNYTVGEAAFVEIQEVYAGDSFEGIELLTTTPEFFAEQLAKIGSTPVIASDRSKIWWIEERMSFDIKDNTPSTICWWQQDLKDYNEEIEAIFSTGQVP